MKFLFGVIGCAFIAAARAAAFGPGDIVPVVPYGEAIPTEPLQGRITNGQRAGVGQFPHQAGLHLMKSDGTYFCGASLISLSWLVTAAHCTINVQRVLVSLGSTELDKPKAQFMVDASHVKTHEKYVAATLANDIALINIPTVTPSEHIRPIALPAISNSYPSYAGELAIVSGFGQTSDNSALSKFLNFVSNAVITVAECAQVYGTAVVTPNTICMKTPKGQSTCQGDSGGPMMHASKRILIGVTSFVAAAGCKAGYPSGFTRVTSHLTWIKKHTGIPL